MDYRAIKEVIKERVSIVDVVSPYVALQSSGNSLKGKSPFTNEKTPSFFVSPDKGVFYCFSSQKGGDIFTFIQEVEGIDFKESFQLLAEKAGIDLSKYKKVQSGTWQTIYDTLIQAKSTYQSLLTDKEKKLLLNRGLRLETIAVWEIGFAPSVWDTISGTLGRKSKVAVEQAGLCATNTRGIYDRFRGRIIFPFHDIDGRIVGFSGRKVQEGNSDEPKYINTPETSVFHKSKYLYGLYFAKKHIRRHGFSILVEGPTDVILSHQMGFPVAVAVSGTAVTEQHIRLLKQFSNKILLAFDQDEAGLRAAIRTATIALRLGMDVKLVTLPKGEDPAEVIVRDEEIWKRSVKEATHIIDFLLHDVAKKYPKKDQDRIRAVKENVLSIVAGMSDTLSRDGAISSVASFCDISRDAVERSLGDFQERIHRGTTISVKPPKRMALYGKEKLQETVCVARNFLKKESIPIPEFVVAQMKEIGNYLPLVDTSTYEAIGELRFLNEYTDTKERTEKVSTILQETAERLLVLVLKEELAKLIRAERDGGKKILAKDKKMCENIQQRLKELSA